VNSTLGVSMAGNQNFPTNLCESFPYPIKKICSGVDTRSLTDGEGQGHHIIFFNLLRTSKEEESRRGVFPCNKVLPCHGYLVIPCIVSICLVM
jgi:hypothetical protein